MGNKGDSARTRILDSALALFSRKGYCAVTMQAICKSAGFSRGGLYRHYQSTEDIFIDIIENEQQQARSELQRARTLGARPDQIIYHFLRARMRAFSQPGATFDIAVSEFAANSERGRQALVHRAQESVQVLTDLILEGNKTGCFHCEHPKPTAEHILWLSEGICRHIHLLPLSEEDIQSQLKLIQQLLG